MLAGVCEECRNNRMEYEKRAQLSYSNAKIYIQVVKEEPPEESGPQSSDEVSAENLLLIIEKRDLTSLKIFKNFPNQKILPVRGCPVERRIFLRSEHSFLILKVVGSNGGDL